MRPGPGLVVMALAFISGARRGSTSSISSKTTITTSSQPPPQPLPPTLLPPTITTSTLLPPTTSSSLRATSSSSSSSSVIAAEAAGSASTASTISPTTSPFSVYEHFGFLRSPSKNEAKTEDHKRHQPKEPEPFDFFNTFYITTTTTTNNNNYNNHNNFLQRSVSPANTFAYTFPLPSHLTHHYDDPRARSVSDSVFPSVKQPRRVTAKFRRRKKRRTRSANVNYKGSGVVHGENLNDSDDSTSHSKAVDSSDGSSSNNIKSHSRSHSRDSALSDQPLAHGLPVHFPSLTAESSRSFDEDDIFALVAEDDLLSEESFDRLVKLTDDKIGDTNEEDYSSGTETVVSSSSSSAAASSSSSSTSGSGSGASEIQDTNQQNALEDFEQLQQNEDPNSSREDDERSKRPKSHKDQEPAQVPKHEHDDEHGGQQMQPDQDNDHRANENDNVETQYNAHLVSNNNEKIVTITDENHKTTQQEDTKAADLGSPEKHRSILDSKYPLTRLNPWISACDLAQPGPESAPDLQGSCSAGTLPVGWVDEGPGPPKCLKSCDNDDEEEEETPFTHKLNKDKMINNYSNINSNNIKNNNNNNNNSNNNNNKHKNKNDNKLNNKLVGYTTTTNTFNIKLRNSQPTISHSSTNDNSNSKKDASSSSTSNNNNNNKRAKQQISQKLLNPFNYYQIHKTYNSNNNKMSKTRRNSNETPVQSTATGGNEPSVPASIMSATARAMSLATSSNITNNNNTTNILQHATTANNHNNNDDIFEFMHKMQQDAAKHIDDVDDVDDVEDDVADDDDDEDGDDMEDIDINLHNDAAVADNAAFIMQLQQFQQNQQQQNQANNNIVKVKLGASGNVANAATSRSGGATQKFELKYNHLQMADTDTTNTKRYHTQQIQLQHLQTNSNNLNSNYGPGNNYNPLTGNSNVNINNNDQSQQQREQQCLEYLGDSHETSPKYLCTQLNSPSHLLAQLRHLRLRNCCERNIYSALHTLALNATLGGGEKCVSILEDLQKLDRLASRITCGLAEILFRFDCRQVYSKIHQCEDCKEAYRRWVCSTLVPYFAEPNDVIKPPKFYQTTTDAGGQHHNHQQHSHQTVDYQNHGTTRKILSNSKSNKSPTSFTISSSSSSSSNHHYNSSNNTNMASNMTTSHKTHNNNNNGSNNNNNKTATAMSSTTILTKSGAAASAATSNFNTATTANHNNDNYDDIQHLQHENSNINNHHHVKRRDVEQQQLLEQQEQQTSNTMQFNDKLNNNYISNDSVKHKKRPQSSPATSPQSSPRTSATTTKTSPTSTKMTSKTLTFIDDNIFINNMAKSQSVRRKTTAPRSRRSLNDDAGGDASLNESTSSISSFAQIYRNKSTNKMRKRNNETKLFFMVDKQTMHQQQHQSKEHAKLQQQQQHHQQQSINSISTANTEDTLFDKDPVISKILKRSKRKIEFRKRRRIRPCLSVCQTVEQKCPYLLPADRAPAMPTQYAGEPTFLCLDYNIAETEEQLRKASHGPNECCYTFCETAADGICTYCNDFLDTQDIELEAERINKESEKKIYNITLKARQETNDKSIRIETKIQQKLASSLPSASSPDETHLKMSTVAIAVRNDTLAVNVTRLAERLPYYAYCEGVYYYDDDINDIPDIPYSEDCVRLPQMQSRCSIPYYADNYITSGEVWSTYRRHAEAQKLMVWLSTLLCLWSCYTARILRLRRFENRKQQQGYEHGQHLPRQQQQQQDLQITKQQNNNNNTAFDRKLKQCKNCENREIMQNANDFKKTVIVWYDITENRILIIYIRLQTRKPQHRQHINACQRLEKPLAKHHLRIRGDGGNLRNFYEFVRRRRRQQLSLLHSKNALILLTHYTNRLKSFMQQTQPHRKRKLTHLKEFWWCWRSFKMLQRSMGKLTNMKKEQTTKKKKTGRSRTRRRRSSKWSSRMLIRIMKKMNFRNFSFSHGSCSLTSCSCNNLNKNNNKNNDNTNNISNTNIIENNNVKTNLKKFKFNFSTCNFKNTKGKHNNNNNNDNNNNNYYNNNLKRNHNKSNDTKLNSKQQQQQQKTEQQQQFSITKLQCNKTSNTTTSNNNSNNHNHYSYKSQTFCQLSQNFHKTKFKQNLLSKMLKIQSKIFKSLQNNSSIKYSNAKQTDHHNHYYRYHWQQQKSQQQHYVTATAMQFSSYLHSHQYCYLHQHCHLNHSSSTLHDFNTFKYRHHQHRRRRHHHHRNRQIVSNKPIKISYNSKINNYRYFYDYNFNINDWWHRHSCWCTWCWHLWDCCWSSLWQQYCCPEWRRRRRRRRHQKRERLQQPLGASFNNSCHDINSKTSLFNPRMIVSIKLYKTAIL